jgi:hypothetical protein
MICFQKSVSLLSPNRFLFGFHRLNAHSSSLYADFMDFEVWSPFENRSENSIMTSLIFVRGLTYFWGQPSQ